MISEPKAAGELLQGLANKDFARLGEALAPAVRFRALVPGEALDLGSRADAAAAFARWFADKEGLEVESSECERVGDRWKLRYRLRVTRRGEPLLVEHLLFGDLEEGRFSTLDLICSGFRPVGAAPAAGNVHRFDAGDLGCGTGLPREFRARIGQIPVGHLLQVVTQDAASREDLPALARMLGHRVHSVGAAPGGDVTILVERVK